MYPVLHTLLEAWPEQQQSIDEAMFWIKANGLPWLKAAGGRVAYRGMTPGVSSHQDFFTKTIRTDRKPLSSSDDLHETLNDSIENCGKVANRTNAAFVSGNLTRANGYTGGIAHNARIVIFTSPFNYTWAPDIYDAWVQFSDQAMHFHDDDDDDHSGHKFIDVDWKGDDNSLKEALSGDHEIMVATRGYAAFDYHFWWKHIAPLLNIDPTISDTHGAR